MPLPPARVPVPSETGLEAVLVPITLLAMTPLIVRWKPIVLTKIAAPSEPCGVLLICR